MSIVTGTLLLFVMVIMVCLLIIILSKKQTRLKTAELLKAFTEMGSKYNLSFSSQEILPAAVIGLDGVNKKLLFLNTEEKNHFFELIELEKITKCRVIKTFRSISIDEWKGKNIEAYYEKIELQFDLSDKEIPILIPFYNKVYNHSIEAPELEQKARYWETILSKMIKNHQKKIA